MKFLIDNALSPILAKQLEEAGYDTAHVRDYDMQAAADEEILIRAQREERVVFPPTPISARILRQSKPT
ncbi:MAG TPA: DUF5615 family PIN-like protein [Solirubrobacterales bacterium]